MDWTTIGTVAITGSVTLAAAMIPARIAQIEARRRASEERRERAGQMTAEFIPACEQARHARMPKMQRSISNAELLGQAVRIGANDLVAGQAALALLGHIHSEDHVRWAELRADLANSVLRTGT